MCEAPSSGGILHHFVPPSCCKHFLIHAQYGFSVKEQSESCSLFCLFKFLNWGRWKGEDGRDLGVGGRGLFIATSFNVKFIVGGGENCSK